MKSYTTLFFDLDDTLWDTAANSKESMSEIYEEYNFGQYYPSFQDFYTVYLKHNNHLWDQYNKGLIKKLDIMTYRFQTLFEKYRHLSEKESRQINDAFMKNTAMKKKTVEGAVELLDNLRSKYQLHIISNGFTEVQYTKLEQSGLVDYFDEVILSDVIGINKPSPQIFTYALEKTNAEKETSLMIGDTYDTDIIGAQNSEIDQVWFNPNGLNPENIKPTYEIKNLFELNDILDK